MLCSVVTRPLYRRAARQNKLGTFNEICLGPVAPYNVVWAREALSDYVFLIL